MFGILVHDFQNQINKLNKLFFDFYHKSLLLYGIISIINIVIISIFPIISTIIIIIIFITKSFKMQINMKKTLETIIKKKKLFSFFLEHILLIHHFHNFFCFPFIFNKTNI